MRGVMHRNGENMPAGGEGSGNRQTQNCAVNTGTGHRFGRKLPGVRPRFRVLANNFFAVEIDDALGQRELVAIAGQRVCTVGGEAGLAVGECGEVDAE